MPCSEIDICHVLNYQFSFLGRPSTRCCDQILFSSSLSRCKLAAGRWWRWPVSKFGGSGARSGLGWAGLAGLGWAPRGTRGQRLVANTDTNIAAASPRRTAPAYIWPHLTVTPAKRACFIFGFSISTPALTTAAMSSLIWVLHAPLNVCRQPVATELQPLPRLDTWHVHSAGNYLAVSCCLQFVWRFHDSFSISVSERVLHTHRLVIIYI